MAERLVPWLTRESAPLAEFLTKVMNSPANVRRSVNSIVAAVESHQQLRSNPIVRSDIQLLKLALDHETLLLSGTGGTVVSKLIERFLIERSTDWELESNGASDYPDLYLGSDDYSQLPDFRRGKDQVYGASLKGKLKRPVRVPDGLEVKTCRRNFAVDCHHAHAGLHLVVIFDRIEKQFVVKDVLVGFLRHELYRVTVPASPTTTLKASFNGQHFISIFPEPD
ncbi:hypothetical protein [Neorhodopirellula pilleata]|uniref:hypothetical protein n=1 Tax=Neorhodopirellula pilleata TaxID=2714738 RepID=UPI0011B3E033|nr:hypothetical protein [Neorhodopirellula pilleata]